MITETYLSAFIPTLITRKGRAQQHDTWRVIGLIMMADEYSDSRFDFVRRFLEDCLERGKYTAAKFLDDANFNASLLHFATSTDLSLFSYNPKLFLDKIGEYVDRTTEDFLLDMWLYEVNYGSLLAREPMQSLFDCYSESLRFVHQSGWDTDLMRVSCFLAYFYVRYGRDCCSMEERDFPSLGDGWWAGDQDVYDSVKELLLCAVTYVTELSLKCVPVDVKTNSWGSTVYTWIFDRCRKNRHFEECTRDFSHAIKRLTGYFDSSKYSYPEKIIELYGTQICPKINECRCVHYADERFEWDKDQKFVQAIKFGGSWTMTPSDLVTLQDAERRMFVERPSSPITKIAEAIRVEFAAKEVKAEPPERDTNSNAESVSKRMKSGRIMSSDIPVLKEYWEKKATEQEVISKGMQYEKERRIAKVMTTLEERVANWKTALDKGDDQLVVDGVGRAPGEDSDEDFWSDDEPEPNMCLKKEPIETCVRELEVYFVVAEDLGVTIPGAFEEPIMWSRRLFEDPASMKRVEELRKEPEVLDLDSFPPKTRLFFEPIPVSTDVPGLLKFGVTRYEPVHLQVVDYTLDYGSIRIGNPTLIGVYDRFEWRYMSFQPLDVVSKLRPFYKRRLNFNRNSFGNYRITARAYKMEGGYWLVNWSIGPKFPTAPLEM